MFAATRRWFRRNRTPIAVGVGVVGAGYVVTQYVIGKINDARERMSNDRIAKENLRRRFEQNQEDCTYTVLALLPTATKNIVEAMDTEAITFEIQKMKGPKAGSVAASSPASPPSISETNLTDEDGKSLAGTSASLQSDSGVHASQVSMPRAEPMPDVAGQKSRKTKRQLWDELTISSITRSFTLIYTLALLTILTRIQLNLLGRRSYLSSVVTLATATASQTISLENKDDDGLTAAAAAAAAAATEPGSGGEQLVYNADFDVNRRYLAFSWWLLHRGWADVRLRVEVAVRRAFGHLSPRDLVTYEAFADLTMKVRREVEGATPEARYRAGWLRYLLPPRGLEDEVIRESKIMEGQSAASLSSSSAEPPVVGGGDASSSAVAAPPGTATTTTTTTTSSLTPSTRRLLDETADIIESPACSHVLSQLLDAGFAWLIETQLATGAFDLERQQRPPPPPSSSLGPAATTEERQAVPLPKILSVLTRQAHAIGDGAAVASSNEYLGEMEKVADLEAFAAVVYSSNWEAEMQDDAGATSTAAVSARGGGERVIPAVVAAEVRESQASVVTAGTSERIGESMVVVDPIPLEDDSQASMESAWVKATGKS